MGVQLWQRVAVLRVVRPTSRSYRTINHMKYLLYSLHEPHINLSSNNFLTTTISPSCSHPMLNLGFLKTRSSSPPGNLGVLDIISALQWTKENIAAFGGDPSRVTIVGQDTGAALANLILISKESKGTYWLLINK